MCLIQPRYIQVGFKIALYNLKFAMEFEIEQHFYVFCNTKTVFEIRYLSVKNIKNNNVTKYY